MGIFDYFQHKEKDIVQEVDILGSSVQSHENTYYRAYNKELDEFDGYFMDVGRFIIEKDKVSIGMIQRVFKIGFNRAARIMDKLEEVGVVGPEEGTKPRRILVTSDEYEKLIENYKTKTKTLNYEEDNLYETPQNIENILMEKFGIEPDFSDDGESLKNLKNIIVPSSSNEIQIEFINALLKYNSPETLGLILIDDSIINYIMYNETPQLVVPVVTDEKKINSLIDWISLEMSDRINKFVEYKVKNIDSYNEKMEEIGENSYQKIVCIINEAKDFLENVFKPLERMLMNSNMVGIYFVLFSRFSLKSLSLGIIGELLEVYTPNQLRMLSVSDSNACINNTNRNFDEMDGHKFEYFCADILKKNNFINVEVTQGSGDHGIDILAEKDDITYAIQCKCYSSDIGNAAVQQAHSGKGFYHKDIAVVMTNRYFTPQAIEEAKTLGVKLWDRNKLNEMIGGKNR